VKIFSKFDKKLGFRKFKLLIQIVRKQDS